MIIETTQNITATITGLQNLISGLQGICKEQNMQIGILNRKIDKLTERVYYLERMREIEKV